MLAVTKLLESLAKDNIQEKEDCNVDYDFNKVLEFCRDSTTPKHKIRYSDGQEEIPYLTFSAKQSDT